MSNLPDIDQRYYAVSSAVELLKTTLNDKTVTVVKEQTITITTQYNADDQPEGDPETTAGAVSTSVYDGEVVSDEAIVDGSNGYLLTDLADKLTNDILTDNDKKESTESQETFPILEKHVLSASGSLGLSAGKISNEDALGILSVNVYQQLDEDGTLTFYVSKDAGNNNAYTMRLIFAAEKTENQVSHIEHGAPALMDTDGNYTVTDVETKTVTIMYKWTLTRVEKSTVPDNLSSI